MKKVQQSMLRSAIIGLAVFFCQFVQGQVIFTSTPDSTALVGELYTYDVEAVGSPDAATYSLDVKPSGMTINASSGLISWTPASISQGGKVVVKATNSVGSYYQTFYIYISDAITCPTGLLSYWKLDDGITAGDSTPDFSGGYAAYALTDLEDTIAKVDNGYKIKGGTQYLRVPDRNQYDWLRSSDFSFSVWFKHTGSFVDDECIIARGNGAVGARVVFGIDAASQKPVFRVRTNWMLEDTAGHDDEIFLMGGVISNNQWHHLVAVYDGNPNNGANVTLRLYLDNVKYTVSNWVHAGYSFAGVDKDLCIGWWDVFQPGQTFVFKGLLDEVTIYNKALLDADVTTVYNNGVAGKATCQPGNYAPVITSTAVTSVNEDSPYSYTLRGRDYESDPLTKSVVVKPSWLSFNASAGILSGIPLNANVGDTTVTLRISDGKVSVDQVFTLSVINVNDAPVVSSSAVTAVNEDQPYTYTIVASDVDAGDVITYTAPVKPGWLSFNPSTHVLSGTPTNDQVGTAATQSFDVTLRVTDLAAAFTDQTFTVTVTNVNDSPVILSKSALSTNEDVAITIQLANLTVSDVDDVYPDDFTLTVKEGTNYTISGNTVTPDANYHGSLTVNFDLSDGTATITDNINVTVLSVNDAPVITSTAKITAKEGSLYSYVITATDADLDNLTYSATKLPAWVSFDAESHVLAGTPQNEDVGADSVVIKVTDGSANAYQRFQVTVSNEINSAPVITSTPVVVAAVGETYSYQMVATDEDLGDVLTYTAVTKPSWLVFQSSTGFLTGIPATGDIGSHEVTLRVSDGIDTDEQSFTIVVGLTGIEDVNASNSLVTNVYPVPVSSSVTFELNLHSNGTIQILTLTGKLLKQVEVNLGQKAVSVDISDLDAALYIFKVMEDNNIQVGKIIKN
jgi:hypothetical protein